MMFFEKFKFWVGDLYNLGFYHIMSVNLLLKLFSFASQLFVAWWLTTEEIGQFSIMQSFLMYVVLLGGLGFNTSTLKLCSENRSMGEKILIHKKAVLYSAILSIIAVVIFLGLNNFGLLIQNAKMRIPFAIFLLSAIPMVLSGIDTSYLQALKEFKKLASTNLIARLISLALIFLLTYSYGLYGLIIANLIGTLIVNLLQYKAIVKINLLVNDKSFPEKESINIYKLHINYSLVSFFANLVYVASTYFDMFFINYLVKDIPEEVGRYAFITLVVSFFFMISESVRQVLIPIFSENSNQFKLWIGVYHKYKKILILSYITIAFAGFFVIPYLVGLVYGNKFGAIRVLLFFMILSWLLNSMTSFLSCAIFGAGEIKMNFLSGLIILPVSLIVKYFFILNFNMLGAASSNLIIACLTLGIYLISFKMVSKRMKFNIISN